MSDNDTPRLSPSIAQHLVAGCPAIAYADHRLLGGGLPISDEKRANMERGSIIHNLVLEGGAGVVPLPYDDWRKKDAKAARDQARHEGKYPVKEKDMAGFREIVDAIRMSLEQVGVDLSKGHSEKRFEWEANCEAGDVLCSGVMDHVYATSSGGTIIDIKTTKGDVSPAACGKAILDSKSALQCSAYPEALIAETPILAGKLDMLFVFAQSVPPYLVTIGRPNGEMQHIGEARWEMAKNRWHQCLAQDYWPGYADGEIVEFEGAAWQLAQAQAAELESIDE